MSRVRRFRFKSYVKESCMYSTVPTLPYPTLTLTYSPTTYIHTLNLPIPTTLILHPFLYLPQPCEMWYPFPLCLQLNNAACSVWYFSRKFIHPIWLFVRFKRLYLYLGSTVYDNRLALGMRSFLFFLVLSFLRQEHPCLQGLPGYFTLARFFAVKKKHKM